METADLVIVGGGVAGAALATVLSRAGLGCVVVERSAQFEDRTKGEWLAPWGVAEAHRLGLSDEVNRARGHTITRHARFGPTIDGPTALATAMTLDVLPGVAGPMTQRHPDLCQALLDSASAAGATVYRGTGPVAVSAGPAPEASFASADGTERVVKARLVVAADGRSSAIRRHFGLTLHRDPRHHLFSGLLVDGADAWPPDLQMIGTNATTHYLAFPQGGGRARLYLGFSLDHTRFVTGPQGPQRFLAAFDLPEVPGSASFREATAVSGCRTYSNEAAWLDDPVAVAGVAFVGDAAGWDDPITGQGLSVTMRDVRVVSELLVDGHDWSPAALQPYRDERAERLRRLRFVSRMVSKLDAEWGPSAEARRQAFATASTADRSVGMARGAAMVGPERIPAEAFTDEAWEQVFSTIPADDGYPAS